MIERKGITGFAFRVILVYGLFTLPWHGLGTLYGSAFRAVANVLFGQFGSDGAARFEPLPDATTKRDTQLVLRHRWTGREITTQYGSRYTGYLPTAVFVALMVATPLPRRRRLAALGVGLMLISAFVALRVALSLLQGFRFVGLFDYASSGNYAIDLACEVISKSTITSFFMPIFVWLLVSFSGVAKLAASFGGYIDEPESSRGGAPAAMNEPPSRRRRPKRSKARRRKGRTAASDG